MKTLYVMIGVMVGIAASARAADSAPEQKTQGNFSTMKQEVLKELETRIGVLQQARDCVNAAGDHAAMKSCRETQEASMKNVRQERRGMAIKRIEEREQKLDERKRKLQAKEAGLP